MIALLVARVRGWFWARKARREIEASKQTAGYMQRRHNRLRSTL